WAEPLPLEPVILEGQPRETEGGYVLTGPGFDAEAWDAFEALLGDEDALRARFGDGPIVLPGLSGALPAQLLDVGDLAAIDAVAACACVAGRCPNPMPCRPSTAPVASSSMRWRTRTPRPEPGRSGRVGQAEEGGGGGRRRRGGGGRVLAAIARELLDDMRQER